MSQINMRLGKLKPIPTELKEYSKQLWEISNSINDVTRTLRDQSYSSITRITLDKVTDKIMTDAVGAYNIASALEIILKSYKETEERNTLLGRVLKKNLSIETIEAFNKLMNTIDKTKNSFGFRDNDNLSPERESERLSDHYLREEIFALLETDEFSEETWRNSSVEERKKILLKFLNRLEKMYGINVDDEISFEHMETGTRGVYRPDTNSVGINVDYLGRKDSYQIMQTMIHEMRHAYQHATIDDPRGYNISRETVDQWNNNFENYKSTGDGYSYEEYVSQPVEYDAKNMAKQYSDLKNFEPEYEGSW